MTAYTLPTQLNDSATDLRSRFNAPHHFRTALAVLIVIGFWFAFCHSARADGNVSVFTQKGTLIVNGDRNDNRIEIRSDKSGFLVVAGVAGTKINGVVNGSRFYDAKRDVIEVNLSGGEDTCIVEDCVLHELSIRSEWITILDTLVWSRVELDGSMRGRYGAIINLDNIVVHGDTFVMGTNGADYLTVSECRFNDLFQADLGFGNDQVRFNSEYDKLIFGQLTMMLGEGYDSIFVTAVFDIETTSVYHESAIWGGYYWETENTAGIVNLSTNTETSDIDLGTFYGFDW